MISVEREAKTVDEAILKGLAFIGLTLDEVRIEILEEGNKGFLSLGSKLAKVRITERAKDENVGVSFLEGLLDNMGFMARISATETPEAITFEISGENMGAIIGHRGETLDSTGFPCV